jgi:hypothetical protein
MIIRKFCSTHRRITTSKHETRHSRRNNAFTHSAIVLFTLASGTAFALRLPKTASAMALAVPFIAAEKMESVSRTPFGR